LVEIFGDSVGAIGKSPINSKPRKIVRTPRTLVITSSFVDMRAPIPPKSAPYEIKRTLKPRTKRIEPRKTLPFALEYPAAKDK
jgi:hypothetical protein